MNSQMEEVMTLDQYILSHSERNACRCGKCIDVDKDYPLSGHTANMVFFDVTMKNSPTKEELFEVIKEHKGVFGETNIFDGAEHTYMELGGWVGDQGMALQLMGLGSLLDVWDLLTPYTMFGKDFDLDLARQMAGQGMVSIVAKESKER